MRGGVPLCLRPRSLPDGRVLVREYRAPAGVIPLLIGLALVATAVFAYYYIGSGPGRIDIDSAAICAVGAVPFLLVGIAIAGHINEFELDPSTKSATRRVLWFGLLRHQHTTPFDQLQLYIRPVRIDPAAEAPKREVWAGFIMQDDRILVPAISEKAVAVQEAMEVFEHLISQPTAVLESLLTVKQL